MQPEPRVINPTPTIVADLSSAHVPEEYRLFISLPQSYAELKRAYPVLYVLDGNGLFTLVRDTVEILQVAEQVPDIIIVGIGYPKDTYMDTLTLRGRDLSFYELTSEEKAQTDYPFGETGGGERFLEVVRTELLPFVEQNYRADTSDRTIIGWSAGAEFILYTLFHQPELFQRAVAISPWIETGERGIIPVEARYADAHKALRVKLVVAQERTSDAQTANFRQFVDTLQARHYEGFEVQARVYDEEDHFSIEPIAMTHALRHLYR